MDIAVNVPINPTSLGQVGAAILRVLYDRELDPPLFPAGGSISLEPQKRCEEFESWVEECVKKAFLHDRRNPCFKLWHLSGSLQSFSEKQILLTFHETDSLTKQEINVIKNNKTLVTSEYTADVFRSHDLEVEVIPLGFDSNNFEIINKKYFNDERIVFNLCGKFEKRKHHKKVIQAWAKKYGNNKDYYLQCATYNVFFSEKENEELFDWCLEGRNFFNIEFIPYMPENKGYNDFLNSGDIVIGMSGGEGWGLPEFQSCALGKHAVILNGHGYKSWANEINSVLVEPYGKIDSHDGKFFNHGEFFNQGEFLDWKEEDFIDGCERAVNRCRIEPFNEWGKQLQRDFSYENTVDKLFENI
jgi:glycosyltransferase involved in cell wall biosynthesis